MIILSGRAGKMHFKETDCILVMGMRGCGKSYLAKKLQTAWPRRIIIDSLFEYSDQKGRPIFPGAVIVDNFGDFQKLIMDLEKKKSKKFIIIYQAHPETEDGSYEFRQICDLAYYLGNLQLVVEEVQLHATTHQLPRELKNLCLTGRHNNISLLFTSQRPGEINKTILSQCSHIFCGRIIEGNDLKYISNFLNESADRLSSLPDRKFLWRNPENIKEITNDF